MIQDADIGIIGGGAIGLSIAYQLGKSRGKRPESVVVFEAGLPGAASWAGAGILPPSPSQHSSDPLESLQRLSLETLPVWSRELADLTGIDNEYRSCGGLYLAMTPGEDASLAGLAEFWTEVGIESTTLTADEWNARYPAWAKQLPFARVRRAVVVPGEAQLRNPRHLKALQAACDALGVRRVQWTPQQAATCRLDPDDRLLELQAPQAAGSAERWRCQRWVVAAGSWTSQLLARWWGEKLHTGSIFPVKGEMLLFKADRQPFDSILNVGTRYIVPRSDGHVLVGSTEQEVGFVADPTEWGDDQLRTFVRDLLPDVAGLPQVGHWAGLRPASYDQMPLIGPLDRYPDVLIAAGHFRSGLQWSSGTALCIAACLRGETPPIPLKYFRPNR